MRILISGGGTAGHIYPGLALARELKSQIGLVEIVFVGTPQGLEASIIPKSGFSFRAIQARGLKRRFSLSLLPALASNLLALLQSLRIIGELKPQVVVGLGGYVSFPLVFASWIMRVPALIHEQNSVPGLANRALGKLVKNIAVSYPESKKFFSGGKNTVITGNPLREEVCSKTAREGIEVFALDSRRKTLLVFGGSRGARRMNEVMVKLYPLLRERGDLQVLHFSGERDFEEISSALEAAKAEGDRLIYRLYSYTDNIGAAYAVADLALCRAGAITVAELLACGVPAILVPYPFAADGHQDRNASFAASGGAAIVVEDGDLTADMAFGLISELIDAPARLDEMREQALRLGKRDAVKKLAEMVLEAAVR